MASVSLSTASDESFDSLYHELLKFTPPLLPPAKVCNASMTDRISSLLVHPTLETVLHLLNHDLTSAHFLVRHMQAAPQYEGMYLHGILHRIEGDYDNARAWYGDVAESDVFGSIWRAPPRGLEVARDFIQRIEDFKKTRRDGDVPRQRLEEESIEEITGVASFCVTKFGTQQMSDASESWKQPTEGKIKEIGQDMISGGKGYREF